MTDRAEIAELLEKLNWFSHGYYSQKHINKVAYQLKEGKKITDVDVRVLKRLLKKQDNPEL